MTDSIKSLTERRDRAQREFATLGDIQPGSLVENYRKCGKPNCRCAEEGHPGHGPNHLVVRSLQGRSRSIPIRRHEAEDTRRKCDEYKRFRKICDAFLEASEALADAVRAEGRETAGSAPEKGGPSRRRSGRRLRPISTG